MQDCSHAKGLALGASDKPVEANLSRAWYGQQKAQRARSTRPVMLSQVGPQVFSLAQRCSATDGARMRTGALCAQILPGAPVCALVSLNLVTVAEPTFHIARFLPSIRDHKAPLLFVTGLRCCFCWVLSFYGNTGGYLRGLAP